MALLELQNVGKSFGQGQSQFWAIRHVTLSFGDRGLVAIKGKSGSGKSTLLNLMAKLLSPDEGHLYFAGKDLTRIKGKRLSVFHLHEVATVFQHYNLIAGASAEFNVSLPLVLSGQSKSKIKGKVDALFERFGLTALKKRDVDTLSGGEKQRVAIMRSLMNDPKIILADEPTGALDFKSSELVMGMLQEIAKDRLVIFVSHNEDLIASYAQRVIEVKAARVIDLTPAIASTTPKPQINRSYGRHWTGFFTGRNFKRNFWKNTVAYFAGTLGLISLLVALGFYLGSTASLKEQASQSLEYQSARISEKTYVEIENSPLKLVRQVRPQRNEAEDALANLESVSLENDYSYFLPNYLAYEFNETKQDPVSFLPVYDLTLSEGGNDLLVQGTAPKTNDLVSVLVNQEFADLYGNDVLNSRLALSNEYSVSYGGVKDSGALAFHFQIVGVVDEFSFLNGPKVYYSYSALAGLFASLPLEHISQALGKAITIDNLYDLCGNDDPIANYGYLLFIHKTKEVPKLDDAISALLNSGSLIAIDSSCYSVKQAFWQLTSAFSLSLIVFVGIALIGVSLIIAMTSYSNFVSRKKETAILFALGARDNELSNIYINESVSVALVSAVSALLLAPAVERGLNGLIAFRFKLKDLIQIPLLSFLGYRGALEILLILFAMLLAYLASSIPLASLKRMPLSEELKDE